LRTRIQRHQNGEDQNQGANSRYQREDPHRNG
jgi:hypothetical protein